MKRGFTLVEMLIVVVVLVTLMSITFRLASVGEDEELRNKTVSRLQRLENCLSGYYAAYGTYPPVRLHGERKLELAVNKYGIQKDTKRKLSLNWYTETGNHGIGTKAEESDWEQVRAVCKSQPVAAMYPYPENYDAKFKLLKRNYDDGYTSNPGRHTSTLKETDWGKAQFFKFGLMSFLLPRYMTMLRLGPWDRAEIFLNSEQWLANNIKPANPLGTGKRMEWKSVWEDAKDARSSSNKKEQRARIMNIPSHAACARWMPNLEGCCHSPHANEFFGVTIHNDDIDVQDPGNLFSPDSNPNNEGGQEYALDFSTMVDGWEYELYYYSPAPYQSYILWSAGKNHRTFPPWIPRNDFSSDENKCIGAWISDDIIHMSN